MEYRLIAERALGKPLSSKHPVHHYGTLQEHHKIVICESHGYHNILRRRTRIVEAGGHPSTQQICSRCQQVKDLSFFYPSQRNQPSPYCINCANKYYRDKYIRERRSNGIHVG